MVPRLANRNESHPAAGYARTIPTGLNGWCPPHWSISAPGSYRNWDSENLVRPGADREKKERGKGQEGGKGRISVPRPRAKKMPPRFVEHKEKGGVNRGQ